MKKNYWSDLLIPFFLVALVFCFSACDPNGDGGDGDGTTAEVPAAPDNLNAVVSDTDISVELSWQDNSDNESGFVLERKLNTEGEDGFSQVLGDLEADTVLVTDNDVGLEAGKGYEYRVKAFNDSEDSDYSNWAYAYIPAAGGASEQVMAGAVYTAWAAVDNNLWFTWDDPSDAGNAVGQMMVSTTGGQQTGTDIAIDYDQVNETLYIGWIDTTGALWYNWDSDLNTDGNTMARVAMPTDLDQVTTASAVSLDYNPSAGLVYVGWVDSSDDSLWLSWGNPAGTGNGVAGVEVATTEGAQSGSDISVDCDETSETVYTAWIDMAGKVWYNWDSDPNTPGNTMSKIAMPTNTEQATATAVSMDFDTVSGLAFVAWVEPDNSLWFSWGDTAGTGNGVSKVAIETSEGQQSGSDISVDYDPGTEAVYFSWVDTAGKVWYTWDNDFNTPGNDVGKIPMPTLDNQGTGTAVGFCF